MNRKFILSSVVMFVLSMGSGFVVHALILGQDYQSLPSMMRPTDEAAAYLPYKLLAHILMAITFAWIYLKGKDDRPFLAQGIRYSVAIALLTVIPTYLIYYSVQPMPGILVAKQIIFDTASLFVMGIMVAWMNK